LTTLIHHLMRSLSRRTTLWLAAPIWLGLQACANSAAPSPETAKPLWGTEWQLKAIGTQPVMENSRASLQFPEVGRAAGNGSCNRFSGAVAMQGDHLSFEGIASTKMACAGQAMTQERSYLSALQKATRYERQGDTLLIHAAGLEQPLRFSLVK
jgi:heat shock protein HslJ